jgi:hypothetical protein
MDYHVGWRTPTGACTSLAVTIGSAAQAVGPSEDGDSIAEASCARTTNLLENNSDAYHPG